jgi:NAD(P)-dependent dehydrogenase (short-subunit alcohol dehydrogenase family)
LPAAANWHAGSPQEKEITHMRNILITGAGSGLGEGTSLGLAQKGHNVIAAVQTWQQVTALREKARSLNLTTLKVEKLDLLDPYDVEHTLTMKFDVLVNNAGIGEGGPISSIPVDLVRKNFEINVFSTLDFTQRVVKSWVAAGVRGKLVFVSSIVGLVSVPPVPAYAASKHALQSIAEAMYEEFKPFGIQVQTINPGPYLTGFNESMVEAGLRWLSDDTSFVKREAFQKWADALLGKPEGRLDPNDMIARMVDVIPCQEGKFLNVFPPSNEEWAKVYQKQLYERTI